MIERRITFVLSEGGFVSWKVNRLKMLSGLFRSVVVLLNVTRWQRANIERSLQVLSLGNQEFELCQLHIEGSDAELTCMVLTNFINEHFILINAEHKRNAIGNTVLDSSPTFSLDFDIRYLHQHRCSVSDKSDALKCVTECMSSTHLALVREQFNQRERLSSTAIGHGIAFPHIMSDLIEVPSLSIVSLNRALDWQAPALGEVSMIIAIALPKNASRAVLLSFTCLTRSLLDADYCQLLRTSYEPQVLKALLIHKLANLT